MSPRGYGWIPDATKATGESPDWLYAAAPAHAAAIPSSASLADLVIDVLDQGTLGSCVANAFAQAERMVRVVQGEPHAEIASAMFAYWVARKFDHTEDEDSGTSFRSLLDACRRLGVPPDDAWPYVAIDTGSVRDPFRTQPSTDAFRRAYDRRIEYRRIDIGSASARLDAIRAAIASRRPVMCGVEVGEDFEQDAIDPTKPLAPPMKSAGRHAMLVEGYGPDGSFTILNSWSPDWGHLGRCVFSPSYMAAASDIWVLSRATGGAS